MLNLQIFNDLNIRVPKGQEIGLLTEYMLTAKMRIL
jgi:hypothetical protein